VKSIYKVLTEKDTIFDNNNNNICLFNVCRRGNVHLFKFLIKLDADIKKENRYGETPLLCL